MNRPAPQFIQELYVAPEDVQTAIGWCVRSMTADAQEMTSLVSHLCDQVDAKKVRREAQNSPVNDAEILCYLASEPKVDKTAMPELIRDIVVAARENKLILKARLPGTQALGALGKNSDERVAGDNLCKQVREERLRRFVKKRNEISILF